MITTTAPATAAQFTCIATSTSLWVPGNTAIGAISRGLRCSGQSALPTTAQSLTNLSNQTAPVVAVRVA